ncbi:hypothetical protein [Streptomyces bikiniensis]|uniref:hypothetical protein n=1 Tax=Streptomyces bikiniensis TaxID=1896 RepID=UPI000524EE80|nr:hypothetical protein [Streptomyces bikiniensis]
MNRHVRHLVLDGERVVVLSPSEFDKLLASRRQLGGQASRVRALRSGLRELVDRLESLEKRLASADPADTRGLASELGACLRHARKMARPGGANRQATAP